jgi:hypothetical protein
VFLLLYDLLSLKNDVNVASKAKKLTVRKYLRKKKQQTAKRSTFCAYTVYISAEKRMWIEKKIQNIPKGLNL